MSPFNLADYEPVEERLARFWQDHPNGRIATELLNGDHAGESVIIKASIWKGPPPMPQIIVQEPGEHQIGYPQPYRDEEPDATGHAQETPGSNPVNKTSWIENCETSAIGRALANMGYAPKGKRPSREEMEKVAAPSTRPPSARRRTLRKAQKELVMAAKDADVDDELRHRICRMLTGHESVHDMTDADCKRVTEQLGWFQINRAAGMEALADWEARNLA